MLYLRCTVFKRLRMKRLVRSIVPTALTQSFTTFVSDTSGYVGAVVPDSLQTGGQNRQSRIDYFSAITLCCYNKDPNCIRIGKALRGAFRFLECWKKCFLRIVSFSVGFLQHF